MSSTLAPPVAPPTDPTNVGASAEPSGAPPDTAFAPLLAAAQGPPGSTAKTSTRTAVAGGDQAGSDSSVPTQDPNAVDPNALALAAALANQSVAAAAVTAEQVAPAPASAASGSAQQQAAPVSAPVSAPAPLPMTASAVSAQQGVPAPVPAPPVPGQDGASASVAGQSVGGQQPASTPVTAPPVAGQQAPALPQVPVSPAPAPTPAAAPTVATPPAPDPSATKPAKGSPTPATGLSPAPAAPQATAPQAATTPPADPAPSSASTPEAAAPAKDQASQQGQSPTESPNAATAAAVAAPTQVVPAPTDLAASPVQAPAGDVTSSKTGDDTRRSRDEGGAAEQPSPLAPSVDPQSAIQTATVQDVPSLRDPTAVSGTSQPATPVRLDELAQAAQTAVRITSQNGDTSARITLHPDELGSVEIHLRYGSDGITATVRADSPQAAQILHQAAPDLKRALESQGMSLLGFDVRDRSGRPADGDPTGQQGGSNNRGASGEPDDEITGVTAAADSALLNPGYAPAPGTQIDVFA